MIRQKKEVTVGQIVRVLFVMALLVGFGVGFQVKSWPLGIAAWSFTFMLGLCLMEIAAAIKKQ